MSEVSTCNLSYGELSCSLLSALHRLMPPQILRARLWVKTLFLPSFFSSLPCPSKIWLPGRGGARSPDVLLLTCILIYLPALHLPNITCDLPTFTTRCICKHKRCLTLPWNQTLNPPPPRLDPLLSHHLFSAPGDRPGYRPLYSTYVSCPSRLSSSPSSHFLTRLFMKEHSRR